MKMWLDVLGTGEVGGDGECGLEIVDLIRLD